MKNYCTYNYVTVSLVTFYIKALAAQAAINQQLQAAGATSQAMATQAALAYVQQIQVKHTEFTLIFTYR